jgi:hypothetical protein
MTFDVIVIATLNSSSTLAARRSTQMGRRCGPQAADGAGSSRKAQFSRVSANRSSVLEVVQPSRLRHRCRDAAAHRPGEQPERAV